MAGHAKKEPKLSLFAVYAGGLRNWLAKNKWIKENSVLAFLSLVMLICILSLTLNHKYGSKLGETGRELSRDVIIAILIANTVGLFYEFFARKSMAEELLRVVKQQLRKDDQMVERLTRALQEYQRITGFGFIDMGLSRSFLHEDISKNLRSVKEIRVLALHGARLWVNKDLKTTVLNTSASIRVLLLQPDSNYVVSRVGEFPEEYGHKAIRAQIISAIRLLQKWKEKKGAACQTRLYDEIPSFWLVFVDDLLYLSSYSRNRNSQDSEVYKIRSQKHSLFQMFDEHFERLWAGANDVESIEEFRE
jgi:hypothetical protein